ncbi:Ceramide_synthetase [Hexamita inflata]|uniref:Ceramide synthetase n=1 Tax=Hexamita inflata TaxID=28002 RepID=A0AA86NXF9_9EUKA|nr:Ceramide synthetase [Hexamita inflata]
MQNLLTEKNSIYLPLILVPIHMTVRYTYQKIISYLLRNKKNNRKIAESSFYCLQYFALTTMANTLRKRNNLTWNNLQSLYAEKLPNNNSFTTLHAIYLMGEVSVYISALIFLCFETRKNYADFFMTLFHHVVTVSIIIFAYPYGNYNYSVAVAFMHDIADVILEFSKTLVYLEYMIISKLTFVIFAISFIVPRVFIQPNYLIMPFWNGKMDAILKEMDEGVNLLVAYTKEERTYAPILLSIIYVLSCLWSVIILQMVVRMFQPKQWSDIREDEKSKQD